MKHRFLSLFATLAVSFVFAQATFASITFEIGANGVTNGATGNRWVIGTGFGGPETEPGTLLDMSFNVNPLLPNVTFALSPGDLPVTFNFGSVTLNEDYIDVPGENDNLSISAVLQFDLPTGAEQTNTSTVVVLEGTVQGDPDDQDMIVTFGTQFVNFGSGGQFSVDIGDLNITRNSQTFVQATVALIDEPTDNVPVPTVPEPTTLAIWGLGLGAVGMVRLVRRKK